MEHWNNGMVGGGGAPGPSIPVFQYSTLPFLEPHEVRRRRRRVWVWAGLILWAAVMTFLIHQLWDEPVRQWLLAHPNTWHRQDWVNAFRQLGKAYIPVWLILVWSCLTNRWRPTIVVLVALLLVALSVCPLKVLVSRRRPNHVAPISPSVPTSNLRLVWEGDASFPSGDTAAAFAVATVLAGSIRRAWAGLFLAGAGAIGLLRITALAHYPSDVFAGMMIGLLAGWAAVHWTRRWPLEKVLTVGGRWRTALGLVLVTLVPLLCGLAGMKPLQVFLRFYGPVAAGLLLVGALVAWKPQRRTP